MPPFVPLRYSLPLPTAVTDLASAASLDTLLDDIGIVSVVTGETDELAFDLDITIAVRSSVNLSVPALPQVQATLFRGIDPTQLNQFTLRGGWRRAGGVEIAADIPIELSLGIPGLRPAIVDAEGPRPDPARPNLTVQLTPTVSYLSGQGVGVEISGGLNLPPVLLGSSGFALEMHGLTLRPEPFEIALADATLHFPKSLHALATEIAVTDARLTAAGFSGTILWIPPAGGATVPLPGDLADRLQLAVTAGSLTFVDNVLTDGTLTLDFNDLEVEIPGLSGTAILIGAGAGIQARLTTGAEGVGFSLEGITAGLRIAPEILRPVGPDGQPDPALPAVELALGQIDLGIGPDGRFFADLSALSLGLPRCMIGESGVIVEASGITLHLDDAHPAPGRPADWRGVHIGSASLTLPGELGAKIGTLSLTDAEIGNGGFTGRVAVDWNPSLDVDLGGMAFTLGHAEVEFVQNSLVGGAIEGTVVVPFFDGPVGVAIGLSLNGGFAVKLSAVQPPGTNYQGGLVSLNKPGVLDLTLESIGFVINQGVFTVSISGQITPLVGGLDWPGFRVQELSIDSEGHVKLEGGWLELRDQYVLSLYGFQLEISKIGFGSMDDGRRWIGLSGGLKLVDGLTAGASVEGLRVLWDPGTGATSLTLNGVGVEFEVPETVYFKGAIAMTEPAPGVKRFDGEITLSIITIGLEIEAQLVVGYDTVNDYAFFAIYLGVELPAGIPLWATGLGLFGVAGLFALQMEPDKRSDEAWYAIQPAPSWYHRDTVGVTDLGKWRNQEGSFALGAGVTIGTVADNGYTFAGRFLLGIIFPGPILFIEGRANLLKERASLRSEPLFRTLVVLDFRAGEFLMGMDAQYRIDDTGALIDIAGGAEAFFDFNDPGSWHLYVGIKEPRERRIRAEIFERIFEANAYFMLDAQRLETGAWIGYDKDWTFGPLSVILEAWIEGGATLSWKPIYLTGYLWLHGRIEARVFGFGLSIGADARIDAGVFDPFFIRAELSVSVDLPWPLPDASADLVLEWGPDPTPPLLPVPLKEITVEHLKVTTNWPLPATGAAQLLLPNPDGDGDGFFVDPAPAAPNDTVPPPAAAPVVPLDSRPRLTFGRSVHDDALVGVNPSVVEPNASPEPGWEWIGDPAQNQGPARARSGLAEIVLERWDGTRWVAAARKGPSPNAGGVPALFGSWAPVPQLPAGTPVAGSSGPTGNTKLWLWSRSPFDFTRRTGGMWDEWFVDRYPDYPCIDIPPDREICCDFQDFPLGPVRDVPWVCPEHPELTVGWKVPPIPRIVELEPGKRSTRALCVRGGGAVGIRFGSRTKNVKIWVVSASPKDHVECFDYTKLKESRQPNPRRIGEIEFQVFDHQGNPEPNVVVRSWNTSAGALSGIDAGRRTVVNLGADVEGAELILTRFGQPGRVTAVDALGNALDTVMMAAARGAPEAVRVVAPVGRSFSTLLIEAPSDELAIHGVCRIYRPTDLVTATALDAQGKVLGRYQPRNDLIEIPGREVRTIEITAGPGAFCLEKICWTVGLTEAQRASREEMVRHIATETARWQEEGEILDPYTQYRLKVVTTVEIRGFAHDPGFNRVRAVAQCAYFQTDGPPGLTTLSVPVGRPVNGSAAPTGPSDPPQFDSGLNDLTRYVRQTIPPTVAPPGQPPVLPRPVYRAYDVGVLFNEPYVEQLYRVVDRDLGLYLYDANGLPARDARGRLLAPPNRWGRAPALDVSASDERWLFQLDQASCTYRVDRTTIPRPVNLGSDGQVLDPATLYEGRLVPLLAHDRFTGYSLGATASGTGASLAAGLHRWAVRDVGSDPGASRWVVRETGSPAARYLEQSSDVSSGPAARGDLYPGGTFLTREANPRLAANHSDQPANWTDYRASVYLRSSDDDVIGLAVRVTGANCYLVYLDRQLARRRLLLLDGGNVTLLAEAFQGYQSDRDYLVSIEAVGDRIRVHLDGDQIFDVTDPTLGSGSVALFTSANAGAAFTDFRVDDLRAAAPVTYRFAFATSAFADFRHHVSSFRDETWSASLPDSSLVGAAIPASVDPAAGALPPVTEAEARAYASLATGALGAAALQPVGAVEAIRVAAAGEQRAFIVRTGEPIDWSRTDLLIQRAAVQAFRPTPPLDLAIVAAGFALGGSPNDEYLVLLARETAGFGGARIECRAIRSESSPTLPHGQPLFQSSFGVDLVEGPLVANVLWQPALRDLSEFTVTSFPAATPPAWAVGQSHDTITQKAFVGLPTGLGGRPIPRYSYLVGGDRAWTDYRLTVSFRADGAGGVGVLIRYLDPDNCYRFEIDRLRGRMALVRTVAGVETVLWSAPGSYRIGQRHVISVEVDGSRIAVSVDGVDLCEVFDPTLGRGAVGLLAYGGPLATFGIPKVETVERRLGEWVIEDFGPAIARSSWQVANQTASQTVQVLSSGSGSDVGGSALLVDDGDWTDVRLVADLDVPIGEVAGLVFRWMGPDDHYRFVVDLVAAECRIAAVEAGAPTVVWREPLSSSGPVNALIEIEMIGERIRVWWDGVALADLDDARHAAGRAGLLSVRGTLASWWAFAVQHAEPAWELWTTIQDPQSWQSGSRVAVLAGRDGDPYPIDLVPEVKIFNGKAATGFTRSFPARGVDLRIVRPDGTVGHVNRFLPVSAFTAVGEARIVRSSDGTAFAVLTPDRTTGEPLLASGQYRLQLTFHRDNRIRDPESLVLSQNGDQTDEIASIVVPWETRG